MIECHGLTRAFGEGDDRVLAVDDLDFEVASGETHCLLGPNGAGKTTLVRMLATILLPTGGTAAVGGLDVVADADAVRRIVRISLGGDRGFHFGLSTFENVRFWATMYGLGWREATRETERVLDLVGMGNQKRTKADDLSRGMKQRVHLARTLLGDAPLLVLDEPTTGMDPVAAHAFRQLINDLQRSGRTILLTTHNMDEAEQLADRITMLNHGRTVVTDTPHRLRRSFAERSTVIASDIPEELQKRIALLPGVVGLRQERDQVLVDIDGDTQTVLRVLVDGGVVHLRAEPPSLEQIYLQVFGGRGMTV